MNEQTPCPDCGEVHGSVTQAELEQVVLGFWKQIAGPEFRNRDRLIVAATLSNLVVQAAPLAIFAQFLESVTTAYAALHPEVTVGVIQTAPTEQTETTH